MFKRLVCFLLVLSLAFSLFPIPLQAFEPSPEDRALLNKIEKDTLQYFIRFSDKTTGLTRDSSRPGSPSSVAATGFALAAYAIGGSRGWIAPDYAYARILTTLQTLRHKAAHQEGFFYHFLDPKTGKLTGVLIGEPNFIATAKVFGKFSRILTMETYRKAERIYASNGFTTAQSYQTTVEDINNMRQAADSKQIKIDLIALPTYDVVDQLLASNPKYPFGVYTNGKGGFKVAGIMVSTDGAPQLKLAYFSKPYADTTGFPKDWRGLDAGSQDLVDRYAKLAYEKNIQYYGYSNGDAGIVNRIIIRPDAYSRSFYVPTCFLNTYIIYATVG